MVKVGQRALKLFVLGDRKDNLACVCAELQVLELLQRRDPAKSGPFESASVVCTDWSGVGPAPVAPSPPKPAVCKPLPDPDAAKCIGIQPHTIRAGLPAVVAWGERALITQPVCTAINESTF